MQDLFRSIAEMPGPQFLALYAAVAVVTVAVCRMAVVRLARSSIIDPIQLPENADPYEIAYLRGGSNEVSRLAVLRLIEGEFLKKPSEEDKEQTLEPAFGSQTRVSELTSIERAVYDHFSSARKAREVFDPQFQKSIQTLADSQYFLPLEEQGLLTPQATRTTGWMFWLAGSALLLALSTYKFSVAMSKHKHNVGFLVVLTIVAVIAVAIACIVPRLTNRGRDYLRQMQLALEDLRLRLHDKNRRTDTPTMLLAAGVFGTAVLTASAYSYFNTMFPRAAAGGSGCGSSCGSSSSCSGGSGCGGGGGCGGCGGGGGD